AIEDARFGEAVADVLDVGRPRADHEPAFRFLIVAEGRDVLLLAEEDRGLGCGGGAGQSGREATQLPAMALDEATEGGGIAALHGPEQVLVGERVDLNRDEAALVPLLPSPPLAGERKVL